LSGAIRNVFDRGQRPQIIQKDITVLLASAPSRFEVATKVQKLLSAVARRSKQPGDWIEFRDATDPPLAYSAGVGEWIYLTEYAKARGWVEKQRDGGKDIMQLRLTPAGWEELQRRPRTESSTGFVAMSFKEVMHDTYKNAILPAVRDDCGFDCRRIDAKEYNGAIIDEIKAEIRQTRFVVADVTHHSNGVYYEAGFADGLGVPVIWACSSDDAEETHFDTKHLNQIRWTSHEDFRKRLASRIIATIGRGPLKPREVETD
jgi:nucleoside 2-deoxyribosyltransferase